MPRYFVDESGICKDEIIITGEDAKHIGTVLRSRMGEEIEVCNGKGMDYICEITDIEKNKVTLKINSEEESQSEAKTKITLFQGLPKADKMELIIQKCVELGIEKIVPVATERAVVKLDKKDSVKKIHRWQKIAESAAKQSGRGVIPEIGQVLTFKEAIEMAKEKDGALIPFEYEKEHGVKEFTQNFKGETVGFFIGPEGGFCDSEIEYAIENNILPVTLGKRILRTETAAIATLAILLYELG